MSNESRRVAFITGAASGIGRATAELFAARGWWVGAADRDLAGLDELRTSVGGDACATWQLDVTDKAAYDMVMAELAAQTGGRLDLVYNNAGIGVGGAFEEIPIEETLKVIDVNLIGVINGIYAALPLLKATEGSLCFTTSSSAAIYGPAGLAVYGATKSAVKGLTEALAVELAPHGVRVADVLPGVIDTAIFTVTPVFVDGQRVDTGGLAGAVANAPPDGPWRLIEPVEVAQAVWDSYAGDPRLHWYVPAELEQLEQSKAVSPEAVRDERIAARLNTTA